MGSWKVAQQLPGPFLLLLLLLLRAALGLCAVAPPAREELHAAGSGPSSSRYDLGLDEAAEEARCSSSLADLGCERASAGGGCSPEETWASLIEDAGDAEEGVFLLQARVAAQQLQVGTSPPDGLLAGQEALQQAEPVAKREHSDSGSFLAVRPEAGGGGQRRRPALLQSWVANCTMGVDCGVKLLGNHSLASWLPGWCCKFRWSPQMFRSDQYMVSAAPLDEWFMLLASLGALSILDVTVFQAAAGCTRMHLLSFAIWSGGGVAYNVYFTMRYGERHGIEWSAGYMSDLATSVDSVFVVLLILRVHRTPRAFEQRALLCAALGSLLSRVPLLVASPLLPRAAIWVRAVFGVVLMFGGLQAATEDTEGDPAKMLGVVILKRLLGSRFVEEYDPKGQLFIRAGDVNGKVCMTLLFYVALCLQAVDVCFAVDRLGMAGAQSPNQYIVYCSAAWAVFAKRALCVIAMDLLDYFELLKYGVYIIVLFVGVKLALSPVQRLDSGIMCVIVLTVLGVSVIASMVVRMCRLQCGRPPRRLIGATGVVGAQVHDAN